MKKSFGYWMGWLIGCVVAACITLLVITFVVSITVKAATGLVLWLF